VSLFFTRDRARPPSTSARNGWDQVVLKAMMQATSFGQLQTTYGKQAAESVPANFAGYIAGGMFSSGVVFAAELKRVSIFTDVMFKWQRLAGTGGTADLWGDRQLGILEHPWTGGVTGDLLGRMILDADHAGNWYGVRPRSAGAADEIVRLRPDWCDLLLAPRELPVGAGGAMRTVGHRKVGLFYFDGGDRKQDPAVFMPDEFAHFAPMPDPLATYRGMSWLTPVLREIAGDKLATEHGIAFLEHGATPNLVITLPRELTQRQFDMFKDAYKEANEGADNAYRRLLLTGGADVTPVGVNMKDLDMAKLRGLSETRIAMAAGIHPVVLGSSEGMQGSSLNAGNYSAAKRATADSTFRNLWRNACGSLEVIVPPPADSRLWYDERSVAFLREDKTDGAQIASLEATIISTLVTAGFTNDSVVQAVTAGNWSLLQHSGLYSVQLQKPGSTDGTAA
jgi:hypothetical protein